MRAESEHLHFITKTAKKPSAIWTRGKGQGNVCIIIILETRDSWRRFCVAAVGGGERSLSGNIDLLASDSRQSGSIQWTSESLREEPWEVLTQPAGLSGRLITRTGKASTPHLHQTHPPTHLPPITHRLSILLSNQPTPSPLPSPQPTQPLPGCDLHI